MIVREICTYHLEEWQERRQISARKKQLKRQMEEAGCFADWEQHAREYDCLKDILIWKENMHSDHYDFEYVLFIRDELRKARLEGNIKKVIRILRSHPSRNFCNMLNPLLFHQCFVGTKRLIEDFREEITQCVCMVLRCPEDELPH